MEKKVQYCEKTGKECSGKCGCGGYAEIPKDNELKDKLEERLLTEGRNKATRYAEMLRYRQK